MTPKAIAIVLLLLVPVLVFAQDEPGKVTGNYNIQQSIELGGHITSTSGNESLYNTFVNVQDGVRLLDYTLQMRSLDHTGLLMDNLYFTNFGFGGDPESVSRLRISKNKWYDFSGSFRRDINYFDYNLLANPLNPANPFVQLSNSPHAMNTRRKMGDFNLTIAPQSPLRLRLGYSRNVHEGPSLSSYHEGTDILVFQDYRNRADRYQVGVDWKFAPRTQVSFDQYFEHNKVDTEWTDAPFYDEFVSLNGATPVPVNLGAIFNPYYNQPCSNVPVPIISNGNQVKPQCGIYQQYSRFGPTRTDIPTSTLSFVSNYWKKLDFTLQGSYSSAELTGTFNELAQAFVTRTNELAYQFEGPINTKRIAGHVNAGVTYHINDQWSISNQTNWLNWRNPGTWESSEIACFSSLPTTTGTIFTPAGATGSTTCLMYPTAAGAAAYTASSGPDLAVENFVRFLGEKSLFNTSTVEWDVSKHFGAHVGYRIGKRELTTKDFDNGVLTFFPSATASRGGCPATPVGTCVAPFAVDEQHSMELTEHVALIGFRALPVDEWRINADLELLSADNSFTAITPRNAQRFKLRSTYRAGRWGSVSGSINLVEQRKPGEVPFPEAFAVPAHKDHARSYNLNFSITPKDWVAVDFGYSFLDVFSTTGTCMPLTTGVTLEGGPLTSCTGGSLPVVLKYTNMTNTGFANVMIKPVKRVTLNFGYDVTSDAGVNDWLRADTLDPLRVGVNSTGDVVRPGVVGAPGVVIGFASGPNPFQPLGPLGINWHKPFGSVAVDIYQGLTFKAAYNHYGYNEKSEPLGAAAFNPTLSQFTGVVPRDFRANVTTLSLRYAF